MIWREKKNVFAVESTAVHKSDEHNIGRLKTQHGTHVGFANGGVNKQKINLNCILWYFVFMIFFIFYIHSM